MQISTVNRPSTSLKGPVKVPQKEQCGPTPHPRMLELVFEKRYKVPRSFETSSWATKGALQPGQHARSSWHL
jgi:hypothetical protein